MDEASPPVVYKIDAQDRLLSASPEWDRFAQANRGEEIVFAKVSGRSLWDYISGATTVYLYREMLKRVRAGRALRFPFRCDSDACRRFLEMGATPLGDGFVEFEVRPLKLENRSSVRLFLSAGSGAGPSLRMCSWCKKVQVGHDWKEVEAAVSEMGLFERPSAPHISHGICEMCYEDMNRRLELA